MENKCVARTAKHILEKYSSRIIYEMVLRHMAIQQRFDKTVDRNWTSKFNEPQFADVDFRQIGSSTQWFHAGVYIFIFIRFIIAFSSVEFHNYNITYNTVSEQITNDPLEF